MSKAIRATKVSSDVLKSGQKNYRMFGRILTRHCTLDFTISIKKSFEYKILATIMTNFLAVYLALISFKSLLLRNILS